MSRNDSTTRASTRNHSLGLIGVALAGGMFLSGSAFAVQPLAQGYLASAGHAAKAGEGKCGEGKCGEESFAKTDTNHDQKVSREEFIAAAPKRAAEFDRIDTDKNGSISLPEALKSVEAARKAAGKSVGEGKCGEGKCGGQA
ncbi:HvfA family oxazolone/thioamide-modified RiPP metallophore [Lysobacter sp. TAB13]|uniref:HvfA family oxazolone/thioamide-modified RiPP metallophore n=1 Tax=Lysobacter sp. TAB13 TaxID=3233065 RepID=UPI003F9E032D